jgi:hypothetical protein
MNAEPSFASEPSGTSIDLYWMPLGAGGVGFVRLNGRIYEAIQARFERRRPLDLYHTALEVRVAEGRFTIENLWPSSDADIASRGVVVEGPVLAAGSPVSGGFDTRCAAGVTASFRTRARRWQVRSA